MKRLVATALAVSVALCLAACGNTQSGGESTDGSTTAEAGTVWKIGGIGPVTGSAAVYGISCRNAQELAVEEINAAGGINGYPIVMKYDDDEHDAEKSVNAYNELKDWGMQMLLGTPTSGPCIQVSNESVQDNLFQLTPCGVAPECIANPNSFAVCFSSAQQGEKSAAYMKSRMDGAKIGILYDASDVYSSGIRDSFAENAKKLGLSIVADEQFTADNKTDFTIQLQNLRNAEDAATQHFTSAYREKYHETPDQFAADAYDGMYAIKAAAEKANITPAMSVSEIGSAMEQAMTEIRLQGVTGTITWSADGAPSKEPKVVIIRNGVYQIC